jgi:hypothetical protein
MWTPWEPVTVEIEGDQMVLAVWQGRLNLFWLTFLEKGQSGSNSNESVMATLDKPLSEAVQKEVEIQLNRSEYFQGQWSTRAASGFDKPMRFSVYNNYINSFVRIYLTKQVEAGSEVIKIYVRCLWTRSGDSVTTKVFTLFNRQSAPEVSEAIQNADEPSTPLSRSMFDIAHTAQYHNIGALSVTFSERVEGWKKSTPVRKTILSQGGAYTLLPCSNTAEGVSDEIGVLIAPFFYQDRDHTFYVEPTLTEKTPLEWDDWGIRLPGKYIQLDDDEWWRQLPVKAKAPSRLRPTVEQQRRGRDEFAVQLRYELDEQADWLTDGATQLQFGEQVIDQNGAVGLARLTQTDSDRDAESRRRLPVVVGSVGVSHELMARLRSPSAAVMER